MKELGTVTGSTPENRTVVLCKEAPSIGEIVLDGKKNRIGRIYKVFGPVDAPYASVTLNGDCSPSAGTKLYINGANENAKAKRRN